MVRAVTRSSWPDPVPLLRQLCPDNSAGRPGGLIYQQVLPAPDVSAGAVNI
jgi:hypothetical protein